MTYEQLIAALFPSGAPSDFSAHALIIPVPTVQAMAQAQALVGSTKHKVQPVTTIDGRYMIGADILPELAPGGLFEPALPLFDGDYLSGVEVVAWGDAVAMLPVSDVVI